MKIQHYILLALTLCTTVRVHADETIRYVKTTQAGGSYSHQGRSWDDAYDNIQTAIDAVEKAGGGSVYVAAGTYRPTTAAHNGGSSAKSFYTFQMKPGVKVYGGFAGTESSPEERTTVETTVGVFYRNQTILSGSLSDRETKFTFNESRNRFETAFYNNVYHVVTFAQEFENNRAKALTERALLDGFVIKDGYANNPSASAVRTHYAYGAGIYLVEGGEVNRCEIYHCEASRSGGGVYLDGGGRLDYSYVHDCQARGIGVEYGHGGGVFVEDKGTVRHSSIVGNVGRVGGGLCLYNNREVSETPTPTMFAAATLVAGNTALSEAGGVYMRRGGVLNGVTVARNACLGTGATYSDMVTGTAGGVMVRDMAWIYNSVLWGNSCQASQDIQLNSILTNASSTVRPIIDYVALTKSDATDWSGASRSHIIGLSDYNLRSEAESEGAAIGADDRFARFEAPIPVAGVSSCLENIDIASSGDRGSNTGINKYKWEPHTYSDLNGAGVQLRDLQSGAAFVDAVVTVDIRSRAFAPKCTVGAIVAEPAKKAYTMMTSIEDPTEGKIPTFFVDPSYKFEDHAADFGDRWGTPYPSLTPIVEYAKTELLDKGVARVQILMKAGTVGTADHHEAAYMRQTSLRMYSGIRIYGGYDPTLEDNGTEGNWVPNISRRDPVAYPSIISGNITGDYSKAVYHVVRYDDAEHTVLDGLQIRGGNVSQTDDSVEGGHANHDHGAGIHFEGGQDNIVRNCIVAGNTAPRGAAIYITPTTSHPAAELTMTNCVVHNNAVKAANSSSDVAPEDVGVIHLAKGATLTMDHCDVTRNVGAGAYVAAGATINASNSMVFANTKAPYSTIRNLTDDSYYPNVVTESGATINATNILVGEHDTTGHPGVSNILSYDPSSTNYPWMVNPTSNSGVSPNGDVTFYGGKTNWMPRNMNPMVNQLASTEGTDMSGAPRTYGGRADIGAVENRVTPEYPDGQLTPGEVLYVRDYSHDSGTQMETYDGSDFNGEGVPQTLTRNPDGLGLYTASGEYLDGSSWALAINGNAHYSAGEHTIDASSPVETIGDLHIYADLAAYNSDANKYSYKLGMLSADTKSGTTYYATYDTSTSSKIKSETDIQAADSYIFIEAGKGSDGSHSAYKIYNVSQSKYVTYSGVDGAQDRVNLSADITDQNSKWYVVESDSHTSSYKFNIIPATNSSIASNTPGWNYNGGTTNPLSLYERNDNSSQWQIVANETRVIPIHVSGLQTAVNTQHRQYLSTHTSSLVWVGAGEYEYAPSTEIDQYGIGHRYIYKMLEGVEVVGGFPATGNPGMKERAPKEHVSYLETQIGEYLDPEDADRKVLVNNLYDTEAGKGVLGRPNEGRVLYQPEDFTKETSWNGFTLRRGYLFQCMRLNLAGNIQNVVDKVTKSGYSAGAFGGAGAFIRQGGVLENCRVEDNVVFYSSKDETGGYSSQADATAIKGGYHIAGAGVYNAGGTVKNCEIIGNQLYSYRDARQAAWAYGAGLFMGQGTVYNTVISGNDIRTFGEKSTFNENNDVQAGGGCFLFGGSFFNNTVVGNTTTPFDNPDNYKKPSDGSTVLGNQFVYAPGIFVLGSSVVLYNTIIANNGFSSVAHHPKDITYSFYNNSSSHVIYGYPILSVGQSWALVPNSVRGYYNCVGPCEPFYGVGSNSSNQSSSNNAYQEQMAYNQKNARIVDGVRLCAENLLNTDPMVYANGQFIYQEQPGSPCINAGTEVEYGDGGQALDLPSYDAAYTDRIKDCRLDIGAYDYDGIQTVTPTLLQANGTSAASLAEAARAEFYVSQTGLGSSSASDPANAACMQKLQKVLDAAGRYKAGLDYNGTELTTLTEEEKAKRKSIQVVVKIAAIPGATIDYYPTRTAASSNNENVRNYSIQVPRGVELWGGFENPTSLTATAAYDDANRNITAHKSYLGATYDVDGSKTTGYHVVTFTDKLFRADGTQIETHPSLLALGVTGRAVVDGCFIRGGVADGEELAGTDLNANRYGGAAIVTDYGHIRNCIIEDNEAYYGGALALMPSALVSGTLIRDNLAQLNGGAIYVFEDGTCVEFADSRKVAINSGKKDGSGNETRDDSGMAHVYTCTLVDNEALNSGGGVWFNDNARFNSLAIWLNASPNQANVSGQTSPRNVENNALDLRSTLERYPFAYSAVQSVRLSGLNNINLASENLRGTRFTSDADSKSNYFQLSRLSILNHTGMPVGDYRTLQTNSGLSAADFLAQDRLRSLDIHDQVEARTHIDIGALAGYINRKALTKDNLLLRLYVVNAPDVNVPAANKLAESGNTLYSQPGSSFGYPLQRVADAFEYIYKARLLVDGAQDLPFEVVLSGGTYYPTRDITGQYRNSALSQSFLIPEGVHVFGSFHAPYTDNKFYGQYKRPAETINKSYAAFHTTNTTQLSGVVNPGGVLIDQAATDVMVQARPIADVNANSILEPWEFRDQTYLSGDVLNSTERKAYHVLSVLADENLVGKLPTPTTNSNYTGVASKTYKEMGQAVVIDGVNVKEGHALTFDKYALDTKGYQPYDYYHGGGLMVDGNWYANTGNANLLTTPSTPEYKHTTMQTPVGYRNIPVLIRNSVFTDHVAGIGGAISTNGDLYITDSSISHNLAESKSETVVHEGTTYNITTPGNGGALYGTAQVTAINTLFANNEARKDHFEEAGAHYTLLRATNATPYNTFGGSGGVFYGGFHSNYHFLNCDMVRNRSNMYPAIFSLHSMANKTGTTQSTTNQAVNTIFWGNEAIVATTGSTPALKFSANLSANRVSNSGVAPHLHLVADQAELDATDDILWFCGYEEGRGHTPVNTEDHRRLPYSFDKTIKANVQAAIDDHKVNFSNIENSNVLLDPVNAALTGPNFVNPTTQAGVDGYNETADWSPARINVLTDAGSGFLQQDINRDLDFETDGEGDYVGSGIYYSYYMNHPVLKGLIDIGEHQYMIDGNTSNDLLRIAKDPSPTHYESHIDIGVYEYPHVSLHPVEGSEVDILWVSTEEKLENGVPDGSTWKRPTSDLQRAIETLLCSRNGHKKEIRIMEGEYMPKYALDGAKNHSFYINTRLLNDFVKLPLGHQESSRKQDYYAQSITIKGGYSSYLEEIHDPVLYPTTLHQVSGKSDPVFYVADALQRYGKENISNSPSTLYGALVNDEVTPRVMPITLDGLNIYNTRGSAIYYADQTAEAGKLPDGTDATVVDEKTTPAYKAAAPAPVMAWVATDKETVVEKEVVPAKLTISKCRIYDTGNTGATPAAYEEGSAAVYAGQYGGKVLIYNTLFADNKVVPYRGYNTMFVNNTVARNAKEMQFLDGEDAKAEDLEQHNGQGVGGGTGPMLAPSKYGVKADPSLLATSTAIYNSVFWRNNCTKEPTFNPNGSVATKGVYAAQYTAPATAPFVNNAYTVDESRKGEIDANNNRVLSDQNDDLVDGPNFKDPNNASVADRQYGLDPGLTLLNNADNALYYDNVADLSYDTYETGNFHTINKELAYVDRQIGPKIDLGAYEFNERLQRVVYVDPTSNTLGNAGDTWQYPMGKTELQRAINTAALYGATYGQAYVYVKGGQTDEDIILRSGVNIYGSVDATEAAGGFVDAHRDIDENGFEIYDTNRKPHYMADSHLLYNYEAKVRRNRKGLMQNEDDELTSIKSITVDRGYVASIDEDHPLTAIIDGFEVKGATAMPAINLHADNANAVVAARNMVVRGNYAAPNTDEPLIQLGDAMLYNVLVYGNQKAGGSGDDIRYVTSSSEKSCVLNVSLGVSTQFRDIAHKVASLDANNGYDSSPGNNYSNVLYLASSVSGENLDIEEAFVYQPNDQNVSIINVYSEVSGDVPTKYVSSDGTYAYHDVVNYNVDKDLLGNPRKVDGKVDYGCYETYAVESDHTVMAEYSATVLPKIDQDDEEKFALQPEYTLRHEDYPHEGSVIYLRDNATLVLGATYGEENSLGKIGYECLPAHVVVSESANLYGQGNPIKAKFASLDKKVGSNNTQGMVVGLPFEAETWTSQDLKYSTYSGLNRSQWKYKANFEDGAWVDLEGYTAQNFLVEPRLGSFNEGDILRFNGWPGSDGYAYTESVTDKTKKTVVLTQYDSHKLSGNKPEFTNKENMGWNLVGLPYLVSDYQPYDRVTVADDLVSDSGDYLYRMHIPHEIWLYYDGNTTLDGHQSANGAGYYPVNSWDTTAASWHLSSGTPSIWMGEGIFMQTAALQSPDQKLADKPATENVDFYLPVYAAPVSPTRQLTRYYAGADVEDELTPLAPAFHTRKVTVRTGQLRVEVPSDATAVEVVNAAGQVVTTTDTTTDIHLNNGVYILRVRH